MKNIEELKKEYAEQDSRSTAYPIYVTVQELVSIGVMADGYGVNCPYGDGENKTEYKHTDFEGTYEKQEDLIKEMFEYYDEDRKAQIEVYHIEEINIGWIWHDVEFFLTIKGAEQYMKSNAHNHGKLRTYVHWFERRNFEMRGLLLQIGFKIKD